MGVGCLCWQWLFFGVYQINGQIFSVLVLQVIDYYWEYVVYMIFIYIRKKLLKFIFFSLCWQVIELWFVGICVFRVRFSGNCFGCWVLIIRWFFLNICRLNVCMFFIGMCRLKLWVIGVNICVIWDDIGEVVFMIISLVLVGKWMVSVVVNGRCILK